MKSIVIVNPNRYTGYSYITYAKTFLEGYNLIGLWTTSDLQINFKTSATVHLNEMIIAEDITYDKLVDTIKLRNPVCFMVGDDSAFSLADRLQNDFFPNHSNDISLYEKRVSKNNYLEYLHQKNLVTSNQYNISIDTIPDLDFSQKYILKPINGAGNENVFVVKSVDTIKNVLNTLILFHLHIIMVTFGGLILIICLIYLIYKWIKLKETHPNFGYLKIIQVFLTYIHQMLTIIIVYILIVDIFNF